MSISDGIFHVLTRFPADLSIPQLAQELIFLGIMNSKDGRNPTRRQCLYIERVLKGGELSSLGIGYEITVGVRIWRLRR